jgi:hypothetical protein
MAERKVELPSYCEPHQLGGFLSMQQCLSEQYDCLLAMKIEAANLQ